MLPKLLMYFASSIALSLQGSTPAPDAVAAAPNELPARVQRETLHQQWLRAIDDPRAEVATVWMRGSPSSPDSSARSRVIRERARPVGEASAFSAPPSAPSARRTPSAPGAPSRAASAPSAAPVAPVPPVPPAPPLKPIELEFDGEGADVLLEVVPMLERFGGDDEVFMVANILGEDGRPQQEEATFLGVSTEPVSAQTAAQLPIRRGTGLTVVGVTEGSPAAAAGVQRYDVLARLDDQLLVNTEQLAVLVRSYKPGDTVKLTVLRGGTEVPITATLGSRTQPVLAPGGQRMDFGFDWARPAQIYSQPGALAEWEKALAEQLRAHSAIDSDTVRKALDEAMIKGQAVKEEVAERVRDAQLRIEKRLAERAAEREAQRASDRASDSDFDSDFDSDSDSSSDSSSDSDSSSSSDSKRSSQSQSNGSRSSQSNRGGQRGGMGAERMVWDDGQTRIERTGREQAVEMVITHNGREVHRGPEPAGAALERLDPAVRAKLLEFSKVVLPAPPAPPAPPGAAAPGTAATPRVRVTPPVPPVRVEQRTSSSGAPRGTSSGGRPIPPPN